MLDTEGSYIVFLCIANHIQYGTLACVPIWRDELRELEFGCINNRGVQKVSYQRCDCRLLRGRYHPYSTPVVVNKIVISTMIVLETVNVVILLRLE